MDLTAFRASLAQPDPPAGLSLPLQALWWEAKGDWPRAHACAQQDDSASGALVHAYLHRVEGDLSNAGYWYNRAGRMPASGALAEEWAAVAQDLLGA
jgi:hypothetical protein